MTTSRTPLRLPWPVAAIIIAGCAVAIVWMIAWIVPFALAGQAYLILAILLAFRYWPPLTAWFLAMPVIHRAVFGLLVGAMILGHLTIRGRTWYPYVAWEIFPYAREEDPVTCRELIGTTESGRTVRLLVEQVFPSIIQFNAPLDAEGRPVPATDHLVAALAGRYNALHASDPVRQVDLTAVAVQVHPPAGEARPQPSCELLKRYAISLVR